MTEPVKSLIKYSQFFQCGQAIEGAIPQQGDLVVAQVSVKARTCTKKQERARRASKQIEPMEERNICKSKKKNVIRAHVC